MCVTTCIPSLQPEDTPYEKKPGSKEVQILVPEQFMGVIIGRGGTKIRELRSKVEAVIKVFTAQFYTNYCL